LVISFDFYSSVGDVTATFEVSDLKTDGKEFDSSIQGALTADSFCGTLATLGTSMPNTTFAQNNGVIAMTKCASRRAGFACGGWLIFFGVFSKISGLITSIPDCVIGGMTIFLFSNVIVSGMALASKLDLHSRRNKFIMALSLCVGAGVTIFPFAFLDQRAAPYTAAFWPCDKCNDTMKGLRNGVSIFLSTGYCIGTVIAMILNFILPDDAGIVTLDGDKSSQTKATDDSGKVDDPDDSADAYSSDKTPLDFGNEVSA
jgi:uric acid-xanthine permease